VASWDEVRAEVPELADAVRDRFGAHQHAVLATLRRDGSPRVSGTETTFKAGHLWLGSMTPARKADDLRRDGRFALHSAPADSNLVEGDARVAGRAELMEDEATRRTVVGDQAPGPFELFRADVTEVVLVTVAGDRLITESWREGRGHRRDDRA
jgi:hypothetical protein